MKTEDVLKGTDTEALDKLYKLFTDKKLDEVGPLALYVWLHRLETWASNVKLNVRTEANAAFAEMKAKDETKKNWEVTSFAQLVNAARPVSYTYPPAVTELVAKAAAAVAEAKKNDKIKVTGNLDPATQVMFKVALKAI